MKKFVITLLTIMTTHLFTNDEAEKYAFISLQAAANAEKSAFIESYLSLTELKEFVATSDLTEQVSEQAKSIKQSDWDKKLSNSYKALLKALNGKALRLDKASCSQVDEGGLTFLGCEIRFFADERAINTRIGMLYIDQQYKTLDIKPLEYEPTLAEVEAKKADEQANQKAIKETLSKYNDILSTGKALIQSYQEYVELLALYWKEGGFNQQLYSKATNADISRLKQRLNAKFPDTLKPFYQDYSNGSGITISGNEEELQFLSTKTITGITDFLKDYCGISEAKIAAIDTFNDELFVFAYDGDTEYRVVFLFDRKGHFYAYNYTYTINGVNYSEIQALTEQHSMEKKINRYLKQLKLAIILDMELEQDVPDELSVEFDDIFKRNL